MVALRLAQESPERSAVLGDTFSELDSSELTDLADVSAMICDGSLSTYGKLWRVSKNACETSDAGGVLIVLLIQFRRCLDIPLNLFSRL